jgi:hypothetical protein
MAKLRSRRQRRPVPLTAKPDVVTDSATVQTRTRPIVVRERVRGEHRGEWTYVPRFKAVEGTTVMSLLERCDEPDACDQDENSGH